jgi:hypothetical protein
MAGPKGLVMVGQKAGKWDGLKVGNLVDHWVDPTVAQMGDLKVWSMADLMAVQTGD